MSKDVRPQNPTLRRIVEGVPSFLTRFAPPPKTPAYGSRTAQACVGSRQKSAGFVVRVGAVPISLVIAPSILGTAQMGTVAMDRPTSVWYVA